ncbi:MAG TPA: cytochrome c peroxidase [Polyangiaceae bacterium]|jgi:cytochrome c peroxidase
MPRTGSTLQAFVVSRLLAALAIFWANAGFGASPPDARHAAARIAVGRRIFFDSALSEPKGTSCASCHEPARAFSGDRNSGVGLATGSRPGSFARRNTPSLFYLKFIPKFRFYNEDDETHALGAEPYGGFFWDGRSDSIAQLVKQPLLNPREMNNGDPAQLAAKLRRAPYAAELSSEFPHAFDTADSAIAALGTALEAFLTSPEMSPFSSKYDAYIRGSAKLSALEAEGLKLFKDQARVGCAKCHVLNDSSAVPERSMFTDYGYEAPGVPRNDKLRSRDDDRGLCERSDPLTPSDAEEWCVSFRTPSLRNVALRTSFMHNGSFTKLRDVVSFYASRASNPARWYRSGVAFDDTPSAYRGLIDTKSPPYNRRAGDAPALTEPEITAIVAFLGTLTDRKR